MKSSILFAIIFIAACALSTGAAAQKVYRCGSAYSQTPCPDAVVVEVEDTRSKAQKSESDMRVRHEAATANAMEKARLQEEAMAQDDTRAATPTGGKKKKAAAQSATASHTQTPGAAPSTAANAKKHKPRNSKKDPEFFTARTVVPAKKANTTAGSAP